MALQIVDSKKIADNSLGFNEPSGLTLAADATHYWSVSDDTEELFVLTDEGRVEPDQSLAVSIDGLEGITTDLPGNRLLAVREDSSEVVAVDQETEKVSRHPLADMAGFDAVAGVFGALRTNSGLEGIAYDPDRGEVLLAKQSDPRLLLRVSSDLSTILGAVTLTADLGFICDRADDQSLDVSDIHYDSRRKVLWVLSDTGQCLLLADPVTGQVLGRALIANADEHAKHMKHPEGLALNADGTELRIVTDNGKNSRMFTLSIE